MTHLRIASINIERSKHLDLVEKFLTDQKPDVLCLQELCRRDIPFIENLLGGKLAYAPMTRHAAEVELETIGVALIARGELQDVAIDYYHGDPDNIQDLAYITADGHTSADPDTIANVLVSGTFQGFRIATTHLNVTRRGESTPWQLALAGKLVAKARTQSERAGAPGKPELLMCGDFNAPRGRATFSLINESFTDGVPAHYTTSIDGSIHRAGPLPYMVDGLFHTPVYKLTDATLHTGVSDHCALTCTLSRA